MNSEKYYAIAKAKYENTGRQIIDATLNGACTVSDKRDYKGIFKL
ncbi:MAG: hypothetical protein ACI936_003785 [Paraglaciecola sp.]